MTLQMLAGLVIPEPSDALSSDEATLLEEVERVIRTSIQPLAQQNDINGRYPVDCIDLLRPTGIMQTGLPVTLGGRGFSTRFSLEAQLRIAMVDSAVAQVFKVHDELSREMPYYSSPEQQKALGTAVVEDGKVLGLAVAEQGRTAEEPLKTSWIEHTDGHYIVDGKKIYTTGAAKADLIATWAFNIERATADNPLLGMQLFLIPKDTAGVTVHEDWNALGQRATDSGSITFDNVQCPAEWLASVPGQAPLSYASLRYQAGFAAILTGIGLGALMEAESFIQTKSRPWAAANVDSATDDPSIQRNLGEYASDLAASYHTVMASAPLFELHHRGEITRGQLALPVSAAKVVAHKAALQATSEIHGLMGTRSVDMRYRLDMFWRNARTLSLHDPVEYKRIEVGRHLLTGWEPEPGIYQ
jgi:alkylation response protein AidB-like acyl-CoA dehydrogenase